MNQITLNTILDQQKQKYNVQKQMSLHERDIHYLNYPNEQKSLYVRKISKNQNDYVYIKKGNELLSKL